jgi:APA family basic amino acid/polyamine antiporter
VSAAPPVSAGSSEARDRPFSLLSLLALGINGTVGVGIFFAPREVLALVAGPAGALVYLLAALGMLPVAVVFGRLGRAFAQDGGPYVWARAAFGPTAGFCLGWLTYVSSALSAGAVLGGIGHQIGARLGIADTRPVSIAVCFALASLAALGLRPSAFGLRVVTVLKLLPLLSLVAVGVWAFNTPVELGAWPSFFNLNAGRATLVVVFALQGFEVVPVLAGHSQSGKSVQRATLVTLWCCAALYALLHLVCALALHGDANEAQPLVAAGRVYAGDTFARVLEAGQLVSALGIAFGQVVTTPHYLAALGTPDGLGSWLGKLRGNGAPLHALMVSALFVTVLVSVGELSSLFVLSSIAVLSQYSVGALSLIRLSLRGSLSGASGGQKGHIAWAVISLLTSLVLASYATFYEVFTTVSVVALGVAVLVGRRMLLARAV